MLYPHNQETYNQICSLFDNNINNVCLVQGMGTGKSFIFMELAKDYFWNKKILYVVPKTTIESNMRKYDDFVIVDRHVEFWTYNIFKNDDAILKAYDNFDVFVVDEAHHLGSKIYGNNLQTLLKLVKTDKSKYFIGMTATNVRDSDKIDVTKYFDITIKGKTTIDCIEEGLMPQIEYLLCSPDVDILDRKKFNIKIDYKNSIDLLSQIIKNNPKDRWLTYYSSIKDMKKNRSVIKSLFPNHKIIEISTDAEHSQNNIDMVKNDEKIVICSVDKLLEGIHLPHMEGILLFRKVQSLTVFTQIFGRITAIGETKEPLFIDCTDTGTRLLNKLLGYNPNPNGTLKRRASSSRPIIYERLKNANYFDISKLLIAQYKPCFDDYYDDVVQYMTENSCSINDITTKTISSNGLKIGEWLEKQRTLIRNLPKEDKVKLEINE